MSKCSKVIWKTTEKLFESYLYIYENFFEMSSRFASKIPQKLNQMLLQGRPRFTANLAKFRHIYLTF